jgi:tagatose-1,6-bisphosphate aldolase
MIFAREITDGLTSLVKKIDAATVKNSGARMGSFVVLLSDDDDAEQKLKDVVAKQGIKKCVLTLMASPAGPRGYNIARDADITVVLYTRKQVKVNYAFKKGEMKQADIAKIVADVSKIVPE